MVRGWEGRSGLVDRTRCRTGLNEFPRWAGRFDEGGVALECVCGSVVCPTCVVDRGCRCAHGVAQDDASFFLTNVGAAIGPFMYLGAKHMFTGYDHLLFLVGVLFFCIAFRMWSST